MKEVLKNSELLKEREWECGWEDHEARQRQRLSRLSLSEKLMWLEQTQQMITHMQTSRPASAGHKDPGVGSSR